LIEINHPRNDYWTSQWAHVRMQFSWWWASGTISTNLDGIWGMSVYQAYENGLRTIVVLQLSAIGRNHPGNPGWYCIFGL